MTRDDVKNLRHGQVIYHYMARNADGSPLRARVTGKFQHKVRTDTWWRPVKHGLRTSFQIFNDNVGEWKLTEEEAQG